MLIGLDFRKMINEIITFQKSQCFLDKLQFVIKETFYSIRSNYTLETNHSSKKNCLDTPPAVFGLWSTSPFLLTYIRRQGPIGTWVG